jgi:hypothetical protein
VSEPIRFETFNPTELSRVLREQLCRVVDKNEFMDGDYVYIGPPTVCLKPLPCEDHR